MSRITKIMRGEDGRKYEVSSDDDTASKVTKIDTGYIHIASDTYESSSNLCVKLIEPEPLSVVPMKDILLSNGFDSSMDGWTIDETIR